MAKVDLSFKAIFLRISVLFIFLMNIEISLVNSGLAYFAKAFPDTDPTSISLIFSISTLSALIVSILVMPQLVKRFNKRNIVLVSLYIYLIGGIGPAFFNATIAHVLICRVLLGVGVGLSAPLCGAIINELYSGMERANMLGWANGVGSCVNIVMTLIAGYLCTLNWKYTFFAYGFFIIVLLMEHFSLPSMPVPKIKDADGVEHKVKASYTQRQHVKLVMVLLYGLLFGTFLGVILMKLAIFIEDEKLGDALFTASVMSFFQAGVLTTSFLYGLLEKITKRYIIVVAPILVGIGALFIFNSGSSTTLIPAAFIAGMGLGLMQPITTGKVMAIGPVFNGAFANSLNVGVMASSLFLATYVEKVVGLFILPTAKNLIGTVSFLFIFITAFSLIYVIWDPLKGVNDERKEAPAAYA
ncbi:MAG: MFS transporter [Deltaproteobacteria bacterium]|nr:MFS transporter [Deltaproteobacteria bacterium]